MNTLDKRVNKLLNTSRNKYNSLYKNGNKLTKLIINEILRTENIYGGLYECNDILKINEFDGYIILGHGNEGNVYDINGYAYKVTRILKNKISGVWKKPVVNPDEKFIKRCELTKSAGLLDFGPKYICSYKTKNYYVVIMEKINGVTLNQIHMTSEIRQQLKLLKSNLKKHRLIAGDFSDDLHNDNFMIENDTGKIYAIDL